MSQLPVLTPFELTLENELNVEVERFNNGWLFKWYGMIHEGGQTDVDDFRGGRIRYAGIEFGYQQRQIYWQAINRYLDQQVNETFKKWDTDTRVYSNEVRLKSIDGIERVLRRFVERIVANAKQTDRRLRRQGPADRAQLADDNVTNVHTVAQISNLAASRRMLLQHAIEKAKTPDQIKVPKWKWLEEFYAQNKGLIWLGGLMLAAATIIWRFIH